MARSIVRPIVALIFSLALLPALGYAQSTSQAAFDRANELLNNGKTRQALRLYQQLEDKKTVSGGLFLNIGIAYQRMDSLGKAKYYYLKSATFEETKAPAQKALRFVNQQFSHQSAVLPKLPWDVATHWLQDKIGASTILIIGLSLFNLGILIFIACWFIKQLPAFMRTVSFLIAGLAVIVIATAFYTQYVSDRYSEAVLVSRQAPVAEQPRADAPLVSQAFEGYTLTVDHHKSKQYPRWSYVRMSNGLYGWIPTENILML